MSIFRNGSRGSKNNPRGNRRILSSATETRKKEESSSRGLKKTKSSFAINRRRQTQRKSEPVKNRKLAVDNPDTGDVSSEQSSSTKIPTPPEKTIIARIYPFLFSFLRLVAVLVSVGAVVWGGKLLYQYATSSKYFQIEHVEINGNERLNNADVLATAGFQMGDNIFSLDLLKMVHRLEEQPWIVEAKVKQKLPKTVVIDVVERQPEMMVLFDVPYLVDEAGEIFKRWTPGDPHPRCIVTGISKRELLEDMEGAQKIVLDAISLKNRYESTGNGRYATLYEIHREIDGGFSLAVGEKPFYVKLGKAPYRNKLNRLGKLFRKIGKDGKRPLIVYFDNEKRPDRVTVKFQPTKN